MIPVPRRPLKFLPSLAFVFVVAIILGPLLGGRLEFPSLPAPVPPEARQLPLAALYSVLRLTASYLICLVFAIGFGSWAAFSRRARAIIVPVLDILQSVPVLGFFPAAVLFFVTLFRGSHWGVEFASIFLLITCQAWNMAFGVYEALLTRPRELDELSQAFNVPPFLRALRIYLPILTPKLLYNSMISWANGWYFLVACEIIAIGPAHYELVGLGSFLSRSAATGAFQLFALGLLVLVVVIIALDLFVWRPLITWAERFQIDTSEQAAIRREMPFAQLWSGIWNSELVAAATRGLREVFSVVGPRIFRALERFWRPTLRVVPRRAPRRVLRFAGLGLLAAMAIGVVYGAGALLLQVIAHPPSSEVRTIPYVTVLSILRLSAAYLICLVWTIPVALLIVYRPRVGRVLIPTFEILAAIPATAFFPLLAATLGKSAPGREVSAVLLALTGMQWYLLFNLVAGFRAIPSEWTEATRSMGLSRSLYLRKLVIPASLSSLITGSITAWGGGWNSLIISEYFVYQSRVYSTKGLGSLLSRATYELGDVSLLLVGLSAMILTITLVNRFVWRPLFELSADRFRVEG